MLRAFALAAGLLVGLTAPVLAEGARTTTQAARMTDETTQTIRWVYLRSGPGINTQVIGVAAPGRTVSVHDCTRRWCRVTLRGRTGWMWAAYLSQGM